MRMNFTFALFVLLALPFACALDEPIIPGMDDVYKEPTVVVINSAKWQDAFIVSIFANLNGYPMRYIQDPFQQKEFFNELNTNKYSKVIVFSRKDSAVLSLNYLLRSSNLDVRETFFEDHHDLSAKILEAMPSQDIIMVRDDFAFDGISAKYVAQRLNAPIVYSKGAEEIDGRVMSAIEKTNPSRIFLIGRKSDNLEKTLSRFDLVKLQGRDEFDTNNIVNEYILKDTTLYQGVVVTGDVWELSLMNVRDQPMFLVPDGGTYSMIKTSELVRNAQIKVLLGIGQLVTTPGSYLKDTANVRLLVKFGTVRTAPNDAGFIKQDVNIRLEGYELPLPKYDGKITDINPSYTDPFGPATGALIARDKPAPPVNFLVSFEDTGNIDFPAYVVLDIKDEFNVTITTLTSEMMQVYPKRTNTFKVFWANPPAEGKYRVDAKVFGDVYEGLTLPGKIIEFDLRWIAVIFSLLLILIAVLMLVLLTYSSHVLSSDIRNFGGVFKRAGEELDKLTKYIAEVYHFRGKKGK